MKKQPSHCCCTETQRTEVDLLSHAITVALYEHIYVVLPQNWVVIIIIQFALTEQIKSHFYQFVVSVSVSLLIKPLLGSQQQKNIISK